MDKPIDQWLVALYYALKPDDIDLKQLGTDDQAAQFSSPPFANLRDLTENVDLTNRQERYAANLAYVLGTRVGESDELVEPHLQTLGTAILDRIDHVDDAEIGERSLRNGLRRLITDEPRITDEVANLFLDAFKGALDATFDAVADAWHFSGPAAETATMLMEMASMHMDCQGREGRVKVGNLEYPVTVIEYEVCTQSPFERTAPGVDPRNWTTYNPFFFDSVELLTAAPTTPSWHGVIQEKVGAQLTGKQFTTNLAVSYESQPGLAAVAYDLAPDRAVYKPDDNSVKVDYGLFAVMEEGVHRRVRMLKVVHIEGYEGNHEWLCPLWAHQLAMIGWWF
jgi:hypothetical protein